MEIGLNQKMCSDSNQSNWLREEVFSCPHCTKQLYRLYHSPLLDHDHIYCDSCSKSVEVSFYDSVVKEINQGASKFNNDGLWVEKIEERLKPCKCGGHFRFNASRRCHHCQAEIIFDEPGVDLWPGDFYIADDEEHLIEMLTPIVDQFLSEHVRTTDIWLGE